MERNIHHEELVKEVSNQLRPLLQKSEQGIYIYLDDTHKACNKKFADLLGYRSAKEWADTDAPLADVDEADQPVVVTAYESATEKLTASCLEIKMKNVKTGKPIRARMIMVPMAFNGHLLALHFISKI